MHHSGDNLGFIGVQEGCAISTWGCYNTKKISLTRVKMCLKQRKDRRPGGNLGLEYCIPCAIGLVFLSKSNSESF